MATGNATAVQYHSQFRLFMALAIYLHIQDISHHSFLLIFVEFLHINGVKIPTIRNYPSAVKHYFLLYSFPVHMFQNRRLQIFMRSISINATYTPKLKRVFTIDILTSFVTHCPTVFSSKPSFWWRFLAAYIFLH